MLTITKKKGVVCINISLLKKRLKKAILRLLKALSVALGLAGVVWIIGAAGSSDLNLITFNEIITRVFQGLMLCCLAWVLNFIKIVVE